MTAYHGSEMSLAELKPGTWITERRDTAQTFGRFLYAVEIDESSVDWEYLPADLCEWDTSGHGEWRGTTTETIKL